VSRLIDALAADAAVRGLRRPGVKEPRHTGVDRHADLEELPIDTTGVALLVRRAMQLRPSSWRHRPSRPSCTQRPIGA
jgi:hypothetical protein